MKRYYITGPMQYDCYSGDPTWPVELEIEEDPNGEWIEYKDFLKFKKQILEIIDKGTCNRHKYKKWELDIIEILEDK